MVCTHTNQLLGNQRRLKEGRKKGSKTGDFEVSKVHPHLLFLSVSFWGPISQSLILIQVHNHIHSVLK